MKWSAQVWAVGKEFKNHDQRQIECDYKPRGGRKKGAGKK